MSRQNKKERQRLKRKRKQQELRKQRNASIFKQVAHLNGAARCCMNQDWREMGKASIHVLRDGPVGTHVIANFLIDFWCIGLKDVFGSTNATSADYERILETSRNQGVRMVAVPLDEVRRLVAAAVRFARKNGFRLPRRYERWLGVINVTEADCASADLSDFGTPGGKLRYIGTMRDLQQKLIGSIDNFLDREDVEFTFADFGADAFEDDEGYDEDYDGEEEFDEDGDDELSDEGLGATLNEVSDRAYATIRKWIIDSGRQPNERLRQAVDFMMMLAAARAESSPEHAKLKEQELIEEAIHADPDPQALLESINLAREFINRFADPNRFADSVMNGELPPPDRPPAPSAWKLKA